MMLSCKFLQMLKKNCNCNWCAHDRPWSSVGSSVGSIGNAYIKVMIVCTICVGYIHYLYDISFAPYTVKTNLWILYQNVVRFGDYTLHSKIGYEAYYIVGKFGRGKCSAKLLFSSIWWKSLSNSQISQKVFIVSTSGLYVAN